VKIIFYHEGTKTRSKTRKMSFIASWIENFVASCLRGKTELLLDFAVEEGLFLAE